MRGIVTADAHAHPVDPSAFRKGAIEIRARLLDRNGRATAPVTATVQRDPAIPADHP